MNRTHLSLYYLAGYLLLGGFALLLVRSYFVICLAWFYWISRDPLFLVILGVVGLGIALTLGSYLADRSGRASAL